jgi:hypothetical protein
MSGPMGVKAVVSWLNERGYRTRLGARWGIGPLYRILTRPLEGLSCCVTTASTGYACGD